MRDYILDENPYLSWDTIKKLIGSENLAYQHLIS